MPGNNGEAPTLPPPPVDATATKADFAGAPKEAVESMLKMNRILEDILRVTLDKDSAAKSSLSNAAKVVSLDDLFSIDISDYDDPLPLVFLEDTCASSGQTWLDVELFPQVIFDRISNENLPRLPRGSLDYLASCYGRLAANASKHPNEISPEIFDLLKVAIFTNAATFMAEPCVCPEQPAPTLQLLRLATAQASLCGGLPFWFSESVDFEAFLHGIFAALSEVADLKDWLDAFLVDIATKVTGDSGLASHPGVPLSRTMLGLACLTTCLARNPAVAPLLISCSLPAPGKPGVHFEKVNFISCYLSYGPLKQYDDFVVDPFSNTRANRGNLQNLMRAVSGGAGPGTGGPVPTTQPSFVFPHVSRMNMKEADLIAQQIWNGTASPVSLTFEIFNALVRNAASRPFLLSWIDECLFRNSVRPSVIDESISQSNICSDAFLLNLCHVLIKLSIPFACLVPVEGDSEPTGDVAARLRMGANRRMLNIDPVYARLAAKTGVTTKNTSDPTSTMHFPSIIQETMMLPPATVATDASSVAMEIDPDDEILPLATTTVIEEVTPRNATPNFVTEMFFLAHKAISLSVANLDSKLDHTTSQLNRIGDAWQNAKSAAERPGSLPQHQMQATVLEYRFNAITQLYLSLRASLMNPTLCDDLSQMMLATAAWFCHLASLNSIDQLSSSEPPFGANVIGTSLNPSHLVDDDLQTRQSPIVGAVFPYLPEFIAGNVVDCLLFWKRFCLGQPSPDLQSHAHLILNFVVLMMGSRARLNNPYIRAKLALVLEMFLPKAHTDEYYQAFRSSGEMEYRRMVSSRLATSLECAPLASLIIDSVVNIFTTMDASGEGIGFDEKFNYRRPMYAAIQHCWSIAIHRKRARFLADSAAKQGTTSMFLRFVNLLIDDGVFLLDEALSSLAQIKSMEELIEREKSGAALPTDEVATTQEARDQRAGSLHHLKSMARSYNIMSRETIAVILLLTEHLSHFFTQFSLCDRVASMAGYFLLHLVGPKRRDLKVSNLKEVNFEPFQLVQQIALIYVHLSELPAFCSAVKLDVRSYSTQLFASAKEVLTKVRMSSNDLEAFQSAVDRIAVFELAASDEVDIDDAPDEFLDPLMATLMMDPVLLPTSNHVCDRDVITRHLLTDQRDPFNRHPLKLEDLVPQTDLKVKIEEWVKQKRAQTTN